VAEALAKRRGLAFAREECASRVAVGEGLIVALPQTFMNRSGYAARCLAERHGVEPSGVLVVYDDVALPLGRLRLRGRGSAGGHRGMESVIENLQSAEVPRLRLGIAPAGGFAAETDLAEWVLEPFTAAETPAVEAMLTRATEAAGCWLDEGTEAAMNRFNREDLSPAPGLG
jgi:PTH1 family peptidyl-tRNA hydrolase